MSYSTVGRPPRCRCHRHCHHRRHQPLASMLCWPPSSHTSGLAASWPACSVGRVLTGTTHSGPARSNQRCTYEADACCPPPPAPPRRVDRRALRRGSVALVRGERVRLPQQLASLSLPPRAMAAQSPPSGTHSSDQELQAMIHNLHVFFCFLPFLLFYSSPSACLLLRSLCACFLSLFSL